MTFSEILQAVCRDHGVEARLLRSGNCRWKALADARHDLWRRLNAVGWSDADIGRATGTSERSVRDWLDTPRSEA